MYNFRSFSTKIVLNNIELFSQTCFPIITILNEIGALFEKVLKFDFMNSFKKYTVQSSPRNASMSWHSLEQTMYFK